MNWDDIKRRLEAQRPKPKKKSKKADADEKPVADEAVAEATEATE